MCAHLLIEFIKQAEEKQKYIAFSHQVKFNNTGARIFDYIYHMILKLLSKGIFSVKK